MFRIVYRYTTGDTNGSEETSGEISQQWSSLDLAKIALRRMREHYFYVHSKEDYVRARGFYDLAVANKRKGYSLPRVPVEPMKPEWLLDHPTHSNWHFNTPDDNGADVWIYTGSYMGYFESLHGASVEAVAPDESDMSFTV